MQVREATAGEVADVLNVLDGAALEIDHARVEECIERGGVLVATGDAGDGPILGALVLDGDRITAVAVRRNRRGQGIGTALVERATDRRERLVAEFDAAVRPFYEGTGFVVEPATEPARFRGVWTRE